MARCENATSSSNGRARRSRLLATSGESGAAYRQGEMRSISSTVTGLPSALSSIPASLPSASDDIEAGRNRLERIDRLVRLARQCRIRPAATKVLPMSVPVAVMKNALIASAICASRTTVGKARNVIVGMQRAERQPQPRRAFGDGRRADRNDQEAFVLQQSRRIERGLRLADHDRDDGALRVRQIGCPREGARLGERQRQQLGLAARSGRARRSPRRASRAAGRSNRSACGRGCGSARSPAARPRHSRHRRRAPSTGCRSAAARRRARRRRNRGRARRRRSARLPIAPPARRARRAARGRRPSRTRLRSRSSARRCLARCSFISASACLRSLCRNACTLARDSRAPVHRLECASSSISTRSSRPASAGVIPALAR